MEKTTLLVLTYSIIAAAIMNITYIARVHPVLPCTVCFEEDEWKVLYCTAHKTKTPPEKPYTMAEAVTYLSWLGDRGGLPVTARRVLKPFGSALIN
jgi:hypothetical protein